MFCLCLYLFIFSDFCHTNYFNIHLTDLYKIWRDDITLAVNERPEIIFFDHSRDVAMATNFR